jgi:putative redox protein
MPTDDSAPPVYQRPSQRLGIPAAIRTVEVEWQGGMRFRGGPPNAPAIVIDAHVEAGPGPMHTLLLALAACGGADVVSILEKMQVKLRRFRTRVEGLRAAEDPKRYVEIHFAIELAGDGLDEAKARRAIDLSITKYCSVLHSLRQDIAVNYELTIGV